MPSKSQMALALFLIMTAHQLISYAADTMGFSCERPYEGKGKGLRVGIYLIQESTAIAFVEDASEAPWLFLERLHILDLNHEDVPRLGALNLKRASEVVNLGQVDVLHVIRAVIVANLATSPIHAFDLDNLTGFDFACEGDCEGVLVVGYKCRESLSLPSGCHLFYEYSVKRNSTLV